MDKLTVTKIATEMKKNLPTCAAIFHSADSRVADSVHLTLHTEIINQDTCEANYKELLDQFTTLASGSCYSYWLEDGVACLSGCGYDKDLDCYVATNELDFRNFDSCMEATGFTMPPSSAPTPSRCYRYTHKTGVEKEAPILVDCLEPGASCVTTTGIYSGITVTDGRCASFHGYCEKHCEGSTNPCTCNECTEDLCNTDPSRGHYLNAGRRLFATTLLVGCILLLTFG